MIVAMENHRCAKLPQCIDWQRLVPPFSWSWTKLVTVSFVQYKQHHAQQRSSVEQTSDGQATHTILRVLHKQTKAKNIQYLGEHEAIVQASQSYMVICWSSPDSPRLANYTMDLCRVAMDPSSENHAHSQHDHISVSGQLFDWRVTGPAMAHSHPARHQPSNQALRNSAKPPGTEEGLENCMCSAGKKNNTYLYIITIYIIIYIYNNNIYNNIYMYYIMYIYIYKCIYIHNWSI